MTNKSFNIKNLPVKYKTPDMRMISVADLEIINETRLWFEVSLSIGLTLIGLSIDPFKTFFFAPGLICMVFAGFFLWRHLKKSKQSIDELK